MSRNWLRFWGWLISVCVLVVACQGNPSSSDRVVGGEDSDRLVLGTTSKIRTLDPADAYEIMSGNLLYNLGDRLYTNRVGSTELEPQLATALPSISEDGLTYTIPLREGVVFHDGTSFNAAAMVFSLQRFMDNQGTPAYLLSNIVEKVEATGDYELTLKLKYPFAAFPSVLAFTGLCAISPTAYGTNPKEFQPSTFVGTGAYQLTEFGADIIRLTPFENYWGTKPANAGLDIQVFSSSANLFNAVQTGAIDVAYESLDPDQIGSLETQAQQGKLQVIKSSGNGIHYLTVNVLSPPLDQPPVRQALAAAIDRQFLSDRVFQNQVKPLYSLVPSPILAHSPVFERYADANALTRAQDLLKTAGFSITNPATIDLWYRSNLNSNSLAANTIKAMIDDRMAGLMVINLQGVESATAYDNLDKGAYPVFLLDWTPDFLDADNYLEPFLSCEKGSPKNGCQAGASQYQGSFYYNDRVQTLISQERQETDSSKRQADLMTIQTIVAEDVPFIPLWENQSFVFAQNSVTGIVLQPTQQINFSTLKKSS
ncbi:MAG: ABC transporter substrate-binding protein [Prochlorotrichaceae cyanobacterium]